MAKCQRIEVHVAELKQLFNAMDASTFRQRNLDPDAEEFIVGWGRELPRDAPLALVVYLDRPAGLPEEPAILGESLLIGGWVAMWRPLEVFLYDWWPIRLEARLYDRLSAMPVRIAYKDDTKPEAWRSDWPVTSRSVTTSDDKPSAPEPGTARHA